MSGEFSIHETSMFGMLTVSSELVLNSSFVCIFSLKTAFLAVGFLMVVASFLQLSLVSAREWSNLRSRVDDAQGKVCVQARSLSFTVKDILQGNSPQCTTKEICPRASLCSESSSEEDASFLFDDASMLITAQKKED